MGRMALLGFQPAPGGGAVGTEITVPTVQNSSPTGSGVREMG